jgi:1,4-dihydroxy-2-naphthoyl-CoA hydrolase
MAAEPGATVNLEGESAFMRVLGLNFQEMGPERVVASFEAGPDHHQPWGLVHGGVFTAVIEREDGKAVARGRVRLQNIEARRDG